MLAAELTEGRENERRPICWREMVLKESSSSVRVSSIDGRVGNSKGHGILEIFDSSS